MSDQSRISNLERQVQNLTAKVKQTVQLQDVNIMRQGVGRLFLGGDPQPNCDLEASTKHYVDAKCALISTSSGGGVLVGGVTSLNSLMGALTLAAGTDISITPLGDTLTISASLPSGSGLGTVTSASGTSTYPGLSLSVSNPTSTPFLTLSGTYPEATSSTYGIVKPDNSTITIAGGVITSIGGSAASSGSSSYPGLSVTNVSSGFVLSGVYPKATSNTFGIVEPDNSTITISNGVISSVGTVTSASGTSSYPGLTLSVATPTSTPEFTLSGAYPSATSSTLGIVEPDNTSITVVAGILSTVLPITASGTVTSVAMTGDGTVFAAPVGGSPITTSGTLVPALATQTSGTFLAGPITGSAAAPIFRVPASTDIPPINLASTTNGGVTGILPVANGGTNTSSAPTLAQILIAQSTTAYAPETLSGDATLVSGGALTLATVNSNTGSYGSGSSVPVITVDGKGRITAVSTSAVVPGVVTFNSVQAPSSVTWDGATYIGNTMYNRWRINNTSPPSGGALDFFGIQLSATSGFSGATEYFTFDSYADETGITTGSQYARARAYQLTNNGGTCNVSAYVTATAQAYSSPVRIYSLSSVSGTITINTDNYDQCNLTTLTGTTTINSSGSPVDGQKLIVRVISVGTVRTIAWGSTFSNSGVATAITATAGGSTLTVGYIYDSAKSKFICHYSDPTGY